MIARKRRSAKKQCGARENFASTIEKIKIDRLNVRRCLSTRIANITIKTNDKSAHILYITLCIANNITNVHIIMPWTHVRCRIKARSLRSHKLLPNNAKHLSKILRCLLNFHIVQVVNFCFFRIFHPQYASSQLAGRKRFEFFHFQKSKTLATLWYLVIIP